MNLFHTILMALSLASSSPATAPSFSTTEYSLEPQRPKPLVNLSAIPQVECDGGSGTAFHIGGGYYLTAQHVSSVGNCTVLGQGITVAYEDQEKDYAIFSGPLIPYALNINCEGFKKGQHYRAYGYPQEGFVEMELVALGRYFKSSMERPWQGQAFLQGYLLPGMSGGPIVNFKGEVVGIVNGHRRPSFVPSYSRELKDTTLCTPEDS